MIAEQFLSYTFLFRVLNRNLLDIGSTPVDGSSKNVMSLPPIKASATHSLRLLPPLSYPALVSTNKLSCMVLMKYLTAVLRLVPVNPLILPNKVRCSSGVRFSQIQSNYGHTPTCCIISIFRSDGLISLIKAFPADELVMPVNILRMVDLPAPLGPIMPNISPYFTPNVVYCNTS